MSSIDRFPLQGTGTPAVAAAPPTASLLTPPDGASYRLGQVVAADYSCHDASGGPGLQSCLAPVANGSSIDTRTGGQHTFTVTAVSQDGLSSAVTHHYTVIAAPTATIDKPADNETFSQGQSVATRFSCAEGAGGPGVKSCVDSHGAGGPRGHLDTDRLGNFRYTVRATSNDRLTTTTTIHYNVLPANTRFRVTHLRIRSTGVSLFDVTVPEAGLVNVMETASTRALHPLAAAAAAPVALQPALGRFVFARGHRGFRARGQFHMRVSPNSRGKRLVAHHQHPVRIRLWVTFTPTHGPTLKIGFYRLIVTK